MTTFTTFTFEDQTPDALLDLTDHPEWITQGGTTEMYVRSDSAMHGALGGKIDVADSFRALRYQFDDLRTTAVSADFYFMFPDMPTSLVYLASVSDNTGTGTNTRADMRINVNGSVVVRNGNIAAATSPQQLQPATWYRASWLLEPGTQSLQVFEGDEATPLVDISGALTTLDHSVISFGMITASTGFTLSIDTLRVADERLDPYSPLTPLPTPAGFTLTPSTTAVGLTADWSTVVDATGYQVRLERNVGGVWSPHDTIDTPTPPLVLTTADGLLSGTTYRGGVRAMP